MELAAERAALSPTGLRTIATRIASPSGAVTLVTLAAFVLRLTQLDQSLLGDEVLAYREIVRHSLPGTIDAVRTGLESSPPLFFALAWISAKLGDPTIWIRLPTLVLSTATIPLVYLIGRDTLGRFPGALGAALFALSPFSTYYGVEARPYATVTFFVALSTFALITAVRRQNWRWWAAYAVAAAAAAYSHYTAVFILGIQALWSLWVCRHRVREPVLANLAAVALYVPWLPFVHGSTLNAYALLEPLTLHNVVVDLLRLIPGYPYARLNAIPTLPGLVVVAACAGAGILTLGRRALAHRLALNRWAALIVLIGAATPVGVLLYSVIGVDIWDARDLYPSAPALSLLLAGLIALTGSRARLIGAALVLATLVFGTIRAISPRYARPPYRTAAHYLDSVARPGDPILMPSWGFVLDQALPAQFKRPHRVIPGPRRSWPSPPPGGHVYVVVDDLLLQALKVRAPHERGFTLLRRRDYRGVVDFSIFTFRRQG